VVRAGVWTYRAPDRSLGYATPKWRNSEMGRFVRSLPPDTVIYTNAADYLYLGQRRFGKPIPRLNNPSTRRPDTQYFTKLKLMRKDLAKNGGYIVYFTALQWRTASPSQLSSDIPLALRHAAHDGAAYQLAPAKKRARPKPATTEHAPTTRQHP